MILILWSVLLPLRVNNNKNVCPVKCLVFDHFFHAVDFQIFWTVDKMGEILEPGTVIRPQMDANCAQHLLLRWSYRHQTLYVVFTGV
jgi:hypothetical protein